ncbi:Reverse transcriptase (RNA-dependent DNA polymerase) [Stieleria varia]|uniref:Reverse transcriptase (RNA-dependent DNA polymerase) n=2 Tax=Stieleria varia TaxID=2528005 RepID=A0A5C5ZRB7_9BACT|nr:Reverse transcriptase (RNA-dependent DNA polymerase) [Stieleria varia]
MSYKEAADLLGSPPASCRWKQGRSLAISSRVGPFATGTWPVGRWVALGLRCRSQSVGFTTGTRPVGVWSNRTNGNSYADDFVIFTKTEAAAQRVYASTERFLTDRLKLTVNHDKSNIRKTDGLEYVGYKFRGYGGQIRVSGKKLKAFKERASEIFRRNRGVSMESRYKAFASYARGWLGYFALDQVKTTFTNLDKCPKTDQRRPSGTRLLLETVAEIEDPSEETDVVGRVLSCRSWLCDERQGPVLVGRQSVFPRRQVSSELYPTSTWPPRACLFLTSAGYRLHPCGETHCIHRSSADPHARCCGRGPGQPGPYPDTHGSVQFTLSTIEVKNSFARRFGIE